jgi:GT2 family glycosyltransferase
MISVVCAIHNTRNTAMNCLRMMLRTFQVLGTTEVEFILINDHSDEQQQIPQLLAEFRSQTPPGVKVIEMHFKEHQHYTRALAYGFSLAKGKQVLFVSHDMMLTPDYVRTLLAVGAADAQIGLVRGVSPYVDCFPQHQVVPPFALRSFEDLDSFARYVSEYAGLAWVEDVLLTGDSMLIKREVFDKIGVFDPRYFGYFGDIDFGLRLQRAGFKMVCAKGAWLWHEGAAAYKDKARTTQQDFQIVHNRRMQVVNEAYKKFRQKWDLSMPPEYPGTDKIPFDKLRTMPPSAVDAVIPPMTPPPQICEIR